MRRLTTVIRCRVLWNRYEIYPVRKPACVGHWPDAVSPTVNLPLIRSKTEQLCADGQSRPADPTAAAVENPVGC